MSEMLKKQQLRQDTMELMDSFDTAQQLQDFLEQIEEQQGKQKVLQQFEQQGCGERTLDSLAGMGIIEVHGKQVKLTAYGKQLQQYLNCNRAEIEAWLRRALLQAPKLFKQAGKISGAESADYSGKGPGTKLTSVNMRGELAVAETVMAAARRTITDRELHLWIEAQDICHYERKRARMAEICLVIDASASVAGQRLRAAKFLVRHLLLTTPDRISVITFQEIRATIQVGLTRDYNKVEQSLSGIVSSGATPLALGLRACLKYLHEAGVRAPLVILITDGVSTLAENSRDPLADAVAIARQFKQKNYRFVCIGLKPHKNYLAQLAEAAGGVMYVLDELEKQAVISTALTARSGRY